MPKLERGVVTEVGRGVKCTETLGPLAGEWLCVVLTDKAFPLVMAGGSDVADHAALMRGCMCSLTLTIMDNFYPPEENYSPLGMLLLLFFLLPLKIRDISPCKSSQKPREQTSAADRDVLSLVRQRRTISRKHR